MTRSEIFAKYKIDANLAYLDLSRASLNDAVLPGINLEGAKLTRANLMFANLRSANLENADLERADLSHTCLMNANLKNANLAYADLTGANMIDALVEGVVWDAANLFNCIGGPLRINGSLHTLTFHAPNRIRIGCKELTIDDWMLKYSEIGNVNGYDQQQIEEYRLYIELFKTWYKRRR